MRLFCALLATVHGITSESLNGIRLKGQAVVGGGAVSIKDILMVLLQGATIGKTMPTTMYSLYI